MPYNRSKASEELAMYYLLHGYTAKAPRHGSRHYGAASDFRFTDARNIGSDQHLLLAGPR